MITRRALNFGLLGLAAVGQSRPAFAQAGYPTKAVTMMAAFAAGGGTDVLTRLVAKQVEKGLSQPVLVENRPGADGQLAAGVLKTMAPDGYTLLVNGAGSMTVAPYTNKALGYDPLKDFTPLSMLTKFSVLLVVPKDSPIKSTQDLIERAKAAPGKVTYATPGAGSASHIAGELFNKLAGVHLTQVPFQGSAPASTAVLGGHVDVQFAAPQSVINNIRQGQFRALAYGADTRSSVFPDVPTLEEQGLSGFNVGNWLGLFAPAGVPQDIVDSLSRAVIAAMNDPEIDALLRRDGSEVVASTPDEFRSAIEADYQRMGKILSDLKLVPA
jgi:tripartite-type tricarboxylate transporter receptor subunit TctC